MSLRQTDTRTAFSGVVAGGNISSGMFVCSCNSMWGQACVIVVVWGVKAPSRSLIIIDVEKM